LWLHSVKVAQLLRSAACLHTNQSRSYLNHLVQYVKSGPGSVVGRLPTGWTVRGSNPGGGEIFRTCPDRPEDHTAFYTIGTGSFPGIRCGRCVTLSSHATS